MGLGLDFDRLDHDGIHDFLVSDELAAVIYGLAEDVAGAVEGQVDADVDVVVDTYTTDRAAASVTIAHPTGILLQVRDGVLTSAAASVGLEVKARAVG